MKHSILTLTTAALIAASPAAFAQGVSSDAPGDKTKDSSIPFLPAWLNEPMRPYRFWGRRCPAYGFS